MTDVDESADQRHDDERPSLNDLQAHAVRASVWTAVQAVVGLPVAFAVNLVVARSLGPHGYGLVASYTAVFAILLVILNAGISDATIQWGAAAHARGDRDELKEIGRRCGGFHLLVEAPFGAVATLVLMRHEAVWVQAVGAVSVGLTMAIGTTVVVLTAMSRTALLAKQALFVGLAVQAAVVLAAVETQASGPVWVTRLAASSLAPVIALLLLPRDLRAVVFRPLLPRRWPDGFLRYSLRTLAATLVTTVVYSRCEILVLDAYGRTAQAGLFALAAGLAVQLTAPIDAMLGPLVPAAAGLVAVRRDRAAEAIARGIRLSTLATVPLLLLGVPALAAVAPLIYGGRFTQVGAMFVALGAVSCLQSILHPVTAFVGALRRPILVLGINGVALVVDLGLVILLVPAMGAAAAVVANSVGQVVSLGLSLVLVRREVSLSVRTLAGALRPGILLSVAAATGSCLALTLDHGAIVEALVAVGLSTGLGWLLIRVTGVLATSDDIGAVTSALPRGSSLLLQSMGWLGFVDTGSAPKGTSTR